MPEWCNSCQRKMLTGSSCVNFKTVRRVANNSPSWTGQFRLSIDSIFVIFCYYNCPILPFVSIKMPAMLMKGPYYMTLYYYFQGRESQELLSYVKCLSNISWKSVIINWKTRESAHKDYVFWKEKKRISLSDTHTNILFANVHALQVIMKEMSVEVSCPSVQCDKCTHINVLDCQRLPMTLRSI